MATTDYDYLLKLYELGTVLLNMQAEQNLPLEDVWRDLHPRISKSTALNMCVLARLPRDWITSRPSVPPLVWVWLAQINREVWEELLAAIDTVRASQDTPPPRAMKYFKAFRAVQARVNEAVQRDAVPACAECDRTIPIHPDGSLANKHHAESCSLYDKHAD